jgi:hypothetical protein
MYTNERGLLVRVYVDDEWLHVHRETLLQARSSLQSVPVVLDYVGAVHDDRKVVNTAANLVELYKSHVTVVLDNPPPRLPKDQYARGANQVANWTGQSTITSFLRCYSRLPYYHCYFGILSKQQQQQPVLATVAVEEEEERYMLQY